MLAIKAHFDNYFLNVVVFLVVMGHKGSSYLTMCVYLLSLAFVGTLPSGVHFLNHAHPKRRKDNSKMSNVSNYSGNRCMESDHAENFCVFELVVLRCLINV
jgi:hypothetical protein